MVIWKFQFPVQDEFELGMPEGAEILSVQVQNGMPCLWAAVKPGNGMEKREFAVRGTGHEFTPIFKEVYVGTFQLHGGAFIGHLYEIRR
jgi:hypothetical protein